MVDSWIVSEAGREVTVVESGSAELALAEALARLEVAAQPSSRSTQWVEVAVRSEATGEVGVAWVEVPPAEPLCVALLEHAWREASAPGVDGDQLHRCNHCGQWRHQTAVRLAANGERYSSTTYLPRAGWL
jgi:hypothetical protein